MTPFFSIAVTTYRRPAFLKACLDSIFRQDFQDYEVLIGNDYPQESLSADSLGTNDPRLRFVNHPVNLGEVGNINALLQVSRGRYFTWIMDDDLYSIHFLGKVYQALTRLNFPQAVLTSFEKTSRSEFSGTVDASADHFRVSSGQRLLKDWLEGKFLTTVAYGIYDTDFFKSLGGFETLCEARVGLYGDFLLFIKLALLDRAAYTHEKLILNRVHEHSWSDSNQDLPSHHVAGHRLIQRSGQILFQGGFGKDRRELFSKLVRLTSVGIVEKSKQCFGFVPVREVLRYAGFLRQDFSEVYGGRLIHMGLLRWLEEILWLFTAPAKEKFKRIFLKGTR